MARQQGCSTVHRDRCTNRISLPTTRKELATNKGCFAQEDNVEVKCICSTCNYEGRCYVEKKSTRTKRTRFNTRELF